jgi:PAS domain S-box-containing protein
MAGASSPGPIQRLEALYTGSEAPFRLLAESLPQSVWVRHGDGTLEFINQQGLDYLGLSFDEAASRRLPEEAMHPDDQPQMTGMWTHALAGGEGFELAARLRRHDGLYRWSLIRVHAIRNEHGRAIRWMGTSTDIHDIKENDERNTFLLGLSTELAGISDPQELVCTAMVRLRDRLQVSRVTLAETYDSEAILLSQYEGGESRIEVSSLPLESFHRLAAESGQGLVTALADTCTDHRSAPLYAAWYEPQGIGAIVSAPLMRGGALVALLSVVSRTPRQWTPSEVELVKRVADIVWPAFEKARADRALVVSEERLRLAQGIARIAAWEWDPAANHCFFSPESDELFGLTPGPPHLFEHVVRRVDPRDADMFRQAIDSCRQGGSTDIEHRYLHPSRGLRWIHTKAGLVSQGGRQCIVGISLDITERKLAEGALREVNQRKDEFLAMLAHELRNPLAPIRNAAQILRMHARGNSRLEWARSVIERQARHLTRLVDDLLDVSRIVRGQIVLEKSAVDLSEVVNHAIETSRPLIRERKHQLEAQLPAEPVRVQGDLTRLAQVLANLLINAAKYTNEGGHIYLHAAKEGDTAVLRVRDSGMGISPTLLPHIFELFTQGERTLDRAQGGLGIGLTLVKRIIEMHGGTVRACF